MCDGFVVEGLGEGVGWVLRQRGESGGGCGRGERGGGLRREEGKRGFHDLDWGKRKRGGLKERGGV